jgi:hypothetical protein
MFRYNIWVKKLSFFFADFTTSKNTPQFDEIPPHYQDTEGVF